MFNGPFFDLFKLCTYYLNSSHYNLIARIYNTMMSIQGKLMHELATNWLINQGIKTAYLELTTAVIGLFFITVISGLGYYVARHQILKALHLIILKTQNTWDDVLVEHNVLRRATLIIPYIIILFLTPFFIEKGTFLFNILILLAKILLTIQIARSISALLNVSKHLYHETAKQKYLPLNSIIQIIKLTIYLITIIIVISLLLDRSPIYLLSGLGALTAVLLLVFQDTIKGFVASVQISANKMVVTGDWIELPKYGADGDVIEIGLSTVKIQNFDKTITTVPTYALISDSFKNWRNMYHTGARRIKRTIIIDMGSINFYGTQEIEQLSKINLLEGYLTEKKQHLKPSLADATVNQKQHEESNSANEKQLTNIGTFRAYIENYLTQIDTVRNDLTCMVRQLPATPSGLPLEIYCFATTTDWADYESIQADIFDHLFAIAPHFGLRVFQHPSGFDWKNTA